MVADLVRVAVGTGSRTHVVVMEVLLVVANLGSREEELAMTSTNGDAQMMVCFCNGEDGRANGADEHGDCYVV